MGLAKLVALSGRVDQPRSERLVPPFDHTLPKGSHVGPLLSLLSEP